MVLNDPLANTLSTVANAEQIGSAQCLVKPASRFVHAVLAILNAHHYIGDVELTNDGRGGILKVSLLGKINRCGAIKPRYAVKHTDYVKFEKRWLPAQGMGLLIVSTAKGLLTHEQAKEQGLGG